MQRGQTEAKKQENNKINWHETVKIEYDFNEYQILYFHVQESVRSHLPVQTSQVVGKASATLSQLLHGINRLKVGQYTLLVLVEKCKSEVVQTQLNWQWGGSHLPNMDWFSKSDPFATFYKYAQGKKKVKVYETEVIHNNNDPHWKAWSTTAEKLCPADDVFYVEVSHQERIGKNQTIGWAEIPIKDILLENKTSFPLHTKKNKGSIYLINKEVTHTSTIRTEITFVDYVRNGYSIFPILGVDCCGEYGYHDVLHGFIEILQNYNKQRYAEVYGLLADKCIQSSLEDIKNCTHVEKSPTVDLTKFLEIVQAQTQAHMKFDSYTVAVLLLNNDIRDL